MDGQRPEGTTNPVKRTSEIFPTMAGDQDQFGKPIDDVLIFGRKYGYIKGTVTDLLSGDPILMATVAPGNPYNMQITMAGDGNYSARGYPGYHWLFATAENYTEQAVNIQLQEGDEITNDFRLKPIIPLSDIILVLQLTAGMELSESPTYQVDINKDGKIGMAEIIAYLRAISE